MVLSFVVPAFNEEAYIGDCLEAILKQTKDIQDSTEIIVVNNASTDRTREVALRYPGVRVVDEPRKGLTFARQAGFLASTGSIIANVDSDSRLTPGWVDRVLNEFQSNPRLAGFSGPFIYYDLTDQQRRMVKVFYLLGWVTHIMNKHVLRVGAMMQGGNFVVSRAALEKIGGFNVDISFYGEDTDIARRLNAVGDVVFTFDLKMYSSARRLKHEGMFTMAARYSINYFWTTFLKRPYTREHLDIRESSSQP
ncbi:MAG TPA: glycosyltransferase family A protein [Acidobacteriaceae bacterium]|jgi:glycosyltransferase involved in cell wall biosynthesis|nr:glycosyltransferase family A protein [Acidobacteriaceae bacterium]